MTPLVSVLIPSRKRAVQLYNTVKSIRATATSDDYEILIRFDDDDIGSLEMAKESAYKGCKILIGPRLGYAQLDSGYYAGLEREAQGTWSFIAGDDMRIEGDWIGELRKVPTTGFIVQPDISQLNQSVYPRAEGQAFPIFPRLCWKQFAPEFPKPFDVNGHLLLIANGWKTWFLEGVRFIHDEAPTDKLLEHRK